MNSPHNDQAATLLQQAVTLHRQNRLREADGLYQRILALVPGHFDATHLLGVSARQQGEPARAAELIGRAIALSPLQATAHCNLGAALGDLGQTEQALASYQRAVSLKPDYALAHCNLGNTQRKLGLADEAGRSYRRALELDPAYPEAHCHLAILQLDAGDAAAALASAQRALQARPRYAQAYSVRADALQGLQRFEEALDSYEQALALDGRVAQTWCARGTALQRMHCRAEALASYDQALALQPHYPLAHQYRANSLRALGRRDEAIAACRLALEQGADADHIAFALASLGAGEAPGAAPPGYVASLFDNYADHFDQHLVGGLGYRMPALLDAAIRQHLAGDQIDTLDLGCGTGLCAPLLRPYSRTLAGVDLSEKMLERARMAGLYDTLVCRELGEYLAEGDNRFDLIVAADVFVYIGDLAQVFARAASALRPAGLFAFSVESAAGQPFALSASHRYAHSTAYLHRLAHAHGFQVLEAQDQVGRHEGQVGVPACVLVMRNLKHS